MIELFSCNCDNIIIDVCKYQFNNMKNTQKTLVSLALRYNLMLDALSELISKENDLEVVNQSNNLIELIDSLSKAKFDILVLDSNISGLDVNKIAEINSNNNNANILLLVDNDVNDNYLVNYVKAGIKGYFFKEHELTQLIKSIRVIKDGELWVERRLLPKIIDDDELGVENRNDSPVYKLTQAELRIFKLVLAGYTNKQIAEEVFISEKTVKFHLYKVFRKLSVKSRSELIIFGFKNGFA